MTTQLMQTLPLVPPEVRARVLDPGDSICPFHWVSARPAAVAAALQALAPAFDAHVDVGLALGRGPRPVWVCSRECPARLLLVGQCREARAAFARACAAIVSVDWNAGPAAASPDHPAWKLPWVEADPARSLGRATAQIRAATEAKGVPLVPQLGPGCRPLFRVPPLVLYVDDAADLTGPLGATFARVLRAGRRAAAVGCSRADASRVTLLLGTADPERVPPRHRPRFAVLDLDGSCDARRTVTAVRPYGRR